MMSHLSGGRILTFRKISRIDPSPQSRALRRLTLTQIKKSRREYETKVEEGSFDALKAPIRQSNSDQQNGCRQARSQVYDRAAFD